MLSALPVETIFRILLFADFDSKSILKLLTLNRNFYRILGPFLQEMFYRKRVQLFVGIENIKVDLIQNRKGWKD